jgi:hypothetical protein
LVFFFISVGGAGMEINRDKEGAGQDASMSKRGTGIQGMNANYMNISWFFCTLL